MQADLVADQLGHQHVAFQQLPEREHRADQEQVRPVAVLDQDRDDRGGEPADEAEIRHETEQAGDHADQGADRESDQAETGAVEHAERHHHQQLPAHERAQHRIGLAGQMRHRGLDRTRQQVVHVGHHAVPVAQQVEAHHRDQHQVAEPQHHADRGARHLAEHHARDAADRTQVLAHHVHQPLGVEHVRIQVQLGLDPRQRHVLDPVAVARQVVDQVLHLAHQQRHQQQQRADQQQQQKHVDDAHRQRAAEPEAFEPIGQRIAEIGQRGGEHEGHQHRREQPDQPADHQYDRQQLPALGSVLVHGSILIG